MEGLHGRVRFARTNHPAAGEMVGIVGWVPEGGGEPVALRLVRSRNPGDHDYAERQATIEAARGLLRTAMQIAVKRVPVDAAAENFFGVILDDQARNRGDGAYAAISYDLTADEIAGIARASLRKALLDGDAFRTTRRLCSDLQIEGSMDLFGLVEPLCAAARAEADRPETVAEAAAQIEGHLSRSTRGIRMEIALWKAAMSRTAAREAEAALPAP